MKKLLFMFSAALLSASAFSQTSIYTQDFEGGTQPSQWGQTTAATDGGWKFGVAGTVSSQYFTVPAHTQMAGTNDDACNCTKDNDLLFTDTIDLTGATGTTLLKFESFYFGATYQGATEVATVEVSTDGGASYSVLETLVGNENWEGIVVDLSNYAGNNIVLGFRYNDGGGWLYGWAIDDLEIYQPAALDAELTENTIPNYFDIDDAPLSITGTFTNVGGSAVTSIDLSYSIDNGTAVSDQLTGLNIAPLSNHSFTLPTGWTPSATGNFDVTITVEGINGSNDQVASNNSSTKSIIIYKDAATRLPLYEIFTSSTCAPCLAGNQNFHSVVASFPGEFVEIKYQQDFPGTGDPYCTDETVNRRNYYAVNSIPRMEIDGGWDQNASSFTPQLHNGAKEIPAFIEINGTFTVDAATKTVSAGFTIDPLTDINSNDLRFVVAILEKKTVKNVKTNGETEFLYVVKKMLPDENGEVISGGLQAGTSKTFDKDFTFEGEYRLPSSGAAAVRIDHSIEHSVEDFNNLAVVAWVQDYTTKEVYQSVEATNLTSVNQVESLNNNLKVYPNPLNEEGVIELNINAPGNSFLSVVDITGKTVFQKDLGNLASGKHLIDINGKKFDSGIYLINVLVNNEILSKKITITQ